MTIETATLREIARGEKLPIPHLVEALGALALWAMAEPGRRFEVDEVYGRAETCRAIRVTLYQTESHPRDIQIELAKPVTMEDIDALFELVLP